MSGTRHDAKAARTLWTGGFRSGLEDELLDHLVRERESSPLDTLTVAVPTNLLRQHLSRRLAERLGGHVGVRFATLRDLASQSLPPSFLTEHALLPSGAVEVILRRLIADGLLDGGYFDAVSDRPGVPGVLLRAIRTLREGDLSVERFERVAERAHLLTAGRRNKFREVLRVWKALDAETAGAGWADDLHVMEAAARALEQHAPRSAPVIYGFYDLNALQRRLLTAAIGDHPATVFVPYLDLASFRYADSTLRWFERLGFERKSTAPQDGPDIVLPKNTRLVSAPGEEREARETLRLAVDTMEQGATHQDVAVLLRTPEMYDEAFARDLERLGLPAYVEAPRPLGSTREGRCLRALLRAVESDFSVVEVIEFLELGGFHVDGGPAPLAVWRRAVTLAGITSGAARWREALTRLIERLERSSETDRFAVEHGHLLGPVRTLLDLVSEVTAAFDELPTRAPISLHVDTLLVVFERARPRAATPSDVAAAVRALTRIEQFAGPMGFGMFAELVRRALDAPSPRRSRFGEGGPNVLSLMGARGIPFGVVVIPGLVEKGFPLPKRQDPILLDRERDALNAARDDGGFLPLRGESGSEEELLFRLAVASAEQVLILSYPRLDVAKGRPRTPSVFMLQALEALTGERQDYESFDKSPRVDRIPLGRRFPSRRERSLTEDEFDGCTVLDALDGDSAEAAGLLAEHAVRRRGAKMEVARWGSNFFTEYDGALTSDEARVAIAELCGIGPEGTLPRRTVSATGLAEYAGCPFKYLLHHVLGIEREKPPEDLTEPSALDRGLVYHDALEQLLRALKERGLLPLRADRIEDLRKHISSNVKRALEPLAGYPAALALEAEDLEKHLSLWLAWELRCAGELSPALFEAAFGETDDGGGVRVVLDALGRTASFSGRIDRIDVSDTTGDARVIDYKTGAAPSTKKAQGFGHGTRLQLPIYVIAGDAVLASAGSDARISSSLYLHLRERGGPRTIAFTRGELDARHDDLRRAVALILRGIAEGMLFPWPDGGDCARCDYRKACGVTAMPLALMKRGDRRASEFVYGLAEIE